VEREVVLTRRVPSAALTLELDRPADRSAATTPAGTAPGSQRGASAAPVGSLEIFSRPAGARVLLDGQPIGTTPLRLGVKPGHHAVRLEQAGYAPWSVTVNVGPDRVTRVSASLEPSTEQ
jgi:hypothetical protein